MNQLKITFYSIMLFLLSLHSGIGQGEVLNRNESTGSFLFSSTTNDRVTVRTLSYTYSHKRIFEIGVVGARATTGFRNRNPTGILASAAIILNSNGWVHVKGFYSQSFSSNITSSLGATLFINNSKSTNKLVPTFSLIQNNELGFSPGLSFRFGGSASLLGSINFIKYDGSDWIVGIGFGVMLSGNS